MSIATINPATGETLRTFQPLTPQELERRLQLAADTYRRYRRTSLADRARMMLKAADILDGEKEAFGRMMVTEMGKTIKAAVEEAAKCAWGCRYYAEHAERFLADEVVKTSATRSFIAYQPIGPVLAVMPWNFPFWQVFRFAAPALMAGNVGLLKHASNVPQCALAIEDIFRRAGFPEGCFQTLLIETVARAGVIEDPPGGRRRRSPAAPAPGARWRARRARSSRRRCWSWAAAIPFVVMPSADLEAAVRTAVKARTINNGQSCIAAKRFIVAESIADEFERRFVAGFEALTVGDPMDPATDVGPLANEAQVETIADQVERSVAAGARVLTGGTRLDGPGYYYAPTVLTGVTARFAGLPRRGVRPGGHHFPGARRRRRHPHRQRLALRPRRQRLDHRRGGARALRRRARGGNGVHQRDGGVRSAAAVRRGQAVGVRPRAGRQRAPRIRQHQDRSGSRTPRPPRRSSPTRSDLAHAAPAGPRLILWSMRSRSLWQS